MKKITVLILSAVILLAAGLAAPTRAQGLYGTVRGEVRDATAAVVPGATVKITNDATGESRTQQSTSAGTFSFPELLVGQYTVAVEAPGFSRHTRRNVDVKANQSVDVLVNLQVGEVQQVIEVGAGAELVQTSTAQLVGATFSREVQDLPNPGLEGGRATGSPLNLAILAPGTTTQPGGVLGQGGSIGGNRPRNNNFVVDGLDNNLPSVTGPAATVIQESVQEFTLLTNQFNAEFGHSTAGQFITVTKSGTNRFRGGGWWNLQNRNLNALDNITRSVTRPGADKPRFDWNRFGGQAGGPILKDRWFYYGAYEYRNLTLGSTPSGQILVPTSSGLTALRNLASNAATGVSPVNVGILADNVPVAPAGSRSVNVLNEATGQTVPIEVGTFAASTPNFDREHVFLVSTDVVTGRHRLAGRFNFTRERLIVPGLLPVSQFNSSSLFDTRRATFSDVFAITPRVVNEFRAAYSRVVAASPVDLPKPPGSTDSFANYSVNDLSLAIGPPSNFPQNQANNIYQLVDQVSWQRGRHTIKAGVDARDIIALSSFLPRARGEYTWTSLDLFVRDTFPTAVSIRGVGTANFSQNRAAAFTFVQDTWKVHPRLTLELGVRYEYTQTARDSKLQDLNGMSSIPDFRAHPAFANLPQRHRDALLGHLGNGIIFRRPLADANNWAPRLGLAWDLFGDGKTSFRAGFGLAHDLVFGNIPLLATPPQVQAESRETNACSVSPPPGWCVHVPAGTSALNATGIRFLNTGFIEGGAISGAFPGASRTNPAVSRAFTQALLLDDRSPEAYTWAASLQRQFGQSWLVEGRYVGNHVIHLPVQRWANAGVPLPFRLPVFVNESDALRTNFGGAPTLADAIREANNLLVPFGFNGVVTMFTLDGQSWYHGGSIALQKRMSRGLMFSTNYTFAKTIDLIENELNSSFMNPRRPLDHLNIFNNKGLSGLHRAHKYTLSLLWDLPRYSGSSAFLQKALGGWQYSATYIAESGQPVSAISRRDLNADGDTAGDMAFFNPNGRENSGTDVNFVCFSGGAARIAASAAGCGGAANVVGYSAQDPNARYIRGQTASVSNLGRNTLESPGINVWNMAVIKNTAIGEGRSLQFRVELFNTFNHPNFVVGQGSVFQKTSATLGFPGYVTPGSPQFLDKTIFSGGLGQAPFQRVVQFALKLNF